MVSTIIETMDVGNYRYRVGHEEYDGKDVGDHTVWSTFPPCQDRQVLAARTGHPSEVVALFLHSYPYFRILPLATPTTHVCFN
jgi:hypothetical protein